MFNKKILKKAKKKIKKEKRKLDILYIGYILNEEYDKAFNLVSNKFHKLASLSYNIKYIK